jgi:hypothetical protein
MMSYMMSTSSTPQPQKDSLLMEKALFAASQVSPARGKNRPKRSKSKNKMISKAFNVVAGRPISRISTTQRQITVNMSYTTSAWITTSVTVPVFKGESFVLTNLAASAAYLSVFDQYKFDEIEVWIEPVISQSSAIALVSNYATAVDVDDANTPAAFTDVNDHQSAVVSNGEAGHYHHWKPHVATAVYSGAFTSFANEPACWIDSASPNVQHYGLKFATNSATSTAIIYSLTVRARVSFRGPGI